MATLPFGRNHTPPLGSVQERSESGDLTCPVTSCTLPPRLSGKGFTPSLSTPSRKMAVYGLGLPAFLLVSLVALVLQTYLPLHIGLVTIFDLPLLVVIYFALAWQNPVLALLAGALLGMAQDSLSGGFIGLFGTAKTVIGYVTSSVSTHLETENIGVRFLTVFLVYGLHFALLYFLRSLFQNQLLEFDPGARLLAALVNAILGVLFFHLLDRFRKSS